MIMLLSVETGRDPLALWGIRCGCSLALGLS
jgi:hypothetical protein